MILFKVKLFKMIPLLFTLLFLFSCSAETASSIAPETTAIEPTQIQQQWVLVAIDGQTIDTGISSTLTVSAVNKATGNLACNNFFGTLQLLNNRLKIDKMGSTRKMCQSKTDEVETIVSAILSDWSEVLLSDNRMTLIGKAHKLNYQAKQ